MKSVSEIRVPAYMAPFMERHAQRALEALADYVASCKTLDEKLGALGVLGQLLVTFGDALQARK